jgi:cytochrome c biogenesis protein CcmG, thiol:disulfide interchange protein DsbE
LKQKLLTGLALTAVAALIVIFAAPSYRQGEPSWAGKTAPDFSFTLNGKPATLADLRGKVVVLNFWASWCPPCVEETPSLNALQQQLAPLGGMVLAVSVDEQDSEYRKFIDEYHVIFPTYRDPAQKIASVYRTGGYPETYIINRQGRIERKIIGPQDWTGPDIMAYFRSVLSAN